LLKIENELSTCRTSVLQDGWQTQRHAKKARKWDILAQRKMEILSQIDEIEYLQSLMDTDPFI
jgi:allantoicase